MSAINPRILAATALVLSVSACANLHTINRATDVPGEGKVIHLDAPQRIVHINKKGEACSEPTPDALQAYISSLGGAVGNASNSASVSSALSANAQSVGLHSQSITLMREHMFRMCELAQNGWLSDGDIMLLMERSQDLTMGVLAIEQLTGAMVARQARPNGNASATSSADPAAIDTKPAGKSETPVTQTGSQAAEKAKAVTTALVSANTSDTDAANSSPEKNPMAMTADTARYITEATYNIVAKVLDKRHTTDMCIHLMTRFSREKKDQPEAYPDLLLQCTRIFTAELGARTETSRVSGALPPPAGKLAPAPDR